MVSKDCVAMILAGGQGSRLAPLTSKRIPQVTADTRIVIPSTRFMIPATDAALNIFSSMISSS